MRHSSDPTLSVFSHQPRRSWMLIGLAVFAIHFVAIAIGLQHPSVKPKLKVKTKVVVQTVDLRSPRSDVGIQLAKPALSHPLPKSEGKEKDEKVVAARETLPVESTPPKPSPLPAKAEQKKAVKAEVKASSAPESKAPPVVKKTVAPVKPTTVKATAKPKAAEQPQKKAVDSKAEVEKAEKKKQQEKAEAAEKADRKRAEEEKDKQDRLTAALGALGKSKLSRENMNHQPKRTSLAQVADPKAIGSLEIDVWMSDQGDKVEAWGVQEVNYRDQVGETLKSELKLPEYGAVTIRLTLSHLGKVISIEIVNSQSGKNRAYVEKTLPVLSFPPFGQQFKGELQCTFSFILKNNS